METANNHLKAFIVSKHKIYNLNNIEDLKIVEVMNQNNCITIDITPHNNDVFSNIDTWDFSISCSGILPEWVYISTVLSKVKKVLNEWAKMHIFVGVDNLELNGSIYFLKDCKNSIHYGDCVSIHYGKCTSTHYDKCSSIHYDDCTSVHYQYSKSNYYNSASLCASKGDEYLL